MAQVIPFSQLGKHDVEIVGGKNASLGEMISHLGGLGVNVPNGFATTADAFNRFLNETGLLDKINAELSALDVDDVEALAATGKKVRGWVIDQTLPKDLENEIRQAFAELSKGETSLWRCVRQRPPKICLMRHLQDSKRPF